MIKEIYMYTKAVFLFLTAFITTVSTPAYAEPFDTTTPLVDNALYFPDLTVTSAADSTTDIGSFELTPALWPFSGNEDVLKPKSTRKAFFLSLLVPGLGEWYVGSRRAFAFLGVEAFAWYTYISNNSDGNDLEDTYEQFADEHWHYYDTTNSQGGTLYYNYWGYLRANYDAIDQKGLNWDDYTEIDKIIKDSGSSHSLPATKTQQYYEMIGKYDHFIYGWEDIMANNSALRDSENNPTPNGYTQPTGNIKSLLRLQYMDMRGESNDKLKEAQRGLYIMMINRVLSAIDAGRMAYKYNKKLDSDLSMVHVRMVQHRVNDNLVPMVVVSKSF
jgi:hypothetical protein